MSNMVIRTNVLSLNSHRNLGLTGMRQARASARLSSGFRINSAADDAAGLGISEKMRGQIRGLDQASRNTQDGISLIQTAEGAMSTINEMVIRIRELTVQASNDTNAHDPRNLAQSDRVRIQDEINQLMDEIDATRNRTQFNTRNLIDGSLGTGGVGAAGAGAVLASDAIQPSINGATLSGMFLPNTNLWSQASAGLPDFVGTLVTGFNVRTDFQGGADAANMHIRNLFMDALAAEIGYTGTWPTAANEVASAELNAAVAAWISNISGYTAAPLATIGGATRASVDAALLTIFRGLDVSSVISDDRVQADVFSFAGDTFNLNTNSVSLQAIPPQNRQAALDAGRGAIASWISDEIARGTAGMSSGTPPTIAAFLTALGTILYDPGAGAPATVDTLEQFMAAARGVAYSGTGGEYILDADGVALWNRLEDAINNAMAPYMVAGTGTGGNALWFHVGANVGQGVHLSIEDVGTAALSQIGTAGPANIRPGFTFADLRTESSQAGVHLGQGVELRSGEQINQFLTAIDEALAHVTGQRSILGAMQNRLEFTMENLDIASENLQAANSRIRDADMAREMMLLTQMNVLQQAATAMLAQANQAPQMVLQLLG